MAEKKNIMTYAGLKKLEDELNDLKGFRRKDVAQKIKEAKEQGDLSENADYDAAKNEQAELEERIYTLENMIRKAKIVQEDDVKGDVVNVGLKVKVKDLDMDFEEEFSIVGATESDPFNGKISNESSVGKALIGHRVGDKVAVEVPDGTINYEIIEIIK